HAPPRPVLDPLSLHDALPIFFDAGPEDPVAQVLRMLESRPLSAVYLMKKLPLADKVLQSLERKGFIIAEHVQSERDPLRAASDRSEEHTSDLQSRVALVCLLL